MVLTNLCFCKYFFRSPFIIKGNIAQGLLLWIDTPSKDSTLTWLKFFIIVTSLRKPSTTWLSISSSFLTLMKLGFSSWFFVHLFSTAHISLYSPTLKVILFWLFEINTRILRYGHWFQTLKDQITCNFLYGNFNYFVITDFEMTRPNYSIMTLGKVRISEYEYMVS